MEGIPESPQFPSKEQAIVLTAINDTKLIEYVLAIGNVVTAKNVLFASRMSNDRICIYLSDKSCVDQIISEHSTIVVNDNEVNVRRLINPAKRIIFSNVCPSIPHIVIENLVKQAGFVPVSQMSFLRAGIKSDEYKHVFSFRRQIYVQPDDTRDLPSSLVVKYEETNYRIFLSYDNTCFKCRLAGHLANDCPNITTRSGVENDQNVNTSARYPDTIPHAPVSPEVGSKRPSTDDSLIGFDPLDLSLCLPSDDSGPQRSQQPKKIKPSDSVESLTPTTDLLYPAKELLDNAQYPLSFVQMVEFMEKASGETNIMALVLKYTADVQGLIGMLYDIFPIVQHRSIKNRCKKIQKKIKKAYETYQKPTDVETNHEIIQQNVQVQE
ncbi:hypothetical protein Zmor_010596 [Zophobas morio]|uniref:CCHC-type domain-containing protein n=2 Tax=Zophobas morio TaxID=2755281 RepID=A0AA38MIY3_9CUCU|nr:hypothetical protein Zmor_010596 [Zophobas morio]